MRIHMRIQTEDRRNRAHRRETANSSNVSSVGMLERGTFIWRLDRSRDYGAVMTTGVRHGREKRHQKTTSATCAKVSDVSILAFYGVLRNKNHQFLSTLRFLPF